MMPEGFGGGFSDSDSFWVDAIDNLAVIGAYLFLLGMLVVNVLVVLPLFEPWTPGWNVLVVASVLTVVFVLYRIVRRTEMIGRVLEQWD